MTSSVTITHQQFVDCLPKFEEVFTTHLASQRMSLIYHAVLSQHHTKYIQLVVGSSSHTVKIVISYDQFYQVPIMYFQVFMPGEMDSLVQLLDIQQSGLVRETVALNVDNHPFVSGTFFLVHPCETANTMGSFLGQSSVSGMEYLVTWNAIYGTGIFNDLYLRYISKST